MTDQQQDVGTSPISASSEASSEEKIARHELELLRNTSPDWYLQFLVGLVNDPENESVRIPVTLHVSGLMVSGRLVSGALYFDHMFGEMKHLYQGELLEETRAIYERWSDVYRKDQPHDTGAQYIHLCDAQVWDAEGHRVPSKGGVWWRGRMASVSGFAIGILQTVDDSVPAD